MGRTFRSLLLLVLLLAACGSEEDAAEVNPCDSCLPEDGVCFLEECLCQSVRPLEQCTPNDPTVGRWGTVAVRVGYLAEEQLIQPGSVVLLGGAETKEGWNAWDDPAALGNLTEVLEVFNHRDCSVTVLGTEAKQKLKTPRAFAAAATLPDGRIAIFGGFGADGQPLKSVEILDPLTGTVNSAPAMEKTRALHTATLVSKTAGGYVLLAGGLGTGLKTWEIWSPSEGVKGLANLNEGRFRHSATLVADISGARDMVVLAGGEDGDKVLDTFEVFDLDLKTPSLDDKAYPLCTNDRRDAPAQPMTLHQAVLVPDQGLLYFIGGFKDPGHDQPLKTLCALDVDTEEFNLGAQKLSLGIARGALASSVLSDNAVVFTGGLAGGEPTAMSAIDILFEYLSDTQQLLVDINDHATPLTTPRFQHSAVVTCDDRILLVGGVSLDTQGTLQPAGTAEIFAPEK